MNPRLANHQARQDADMLQREDYSHSPVEIASTVPELVDRERARTADVLAHLMQERRFIAKMLLLGALVAAVISLLIPPKYESTTRIMPPEKQGLGGLAAMLAAEGAGATGSLVGGIVSDAVGLKTSGAIYAAVLKSNTVQDTIINRFDLRHAYHVKYQKEARERLTDNTDINEDRKSGVIAVTVTDRSQQRAADIANAYVESLNTLTAQLNTSAAHRERLFIEDRLKSVKQDLDTASKDLSEFSSKNLTLDVKEQGKAMVLTAATLEGELIAAESQLSGLQQIYVDSNIRVRSMQARIASLKDKLSQLRGTNDDSVDPNSPTHNDFDMSIAKLPSLGVTYFDLYRRVKIQETVFEILTKQYELAKVEEAKELPTIKVLDVGTVPELKSSPKRTLITGFGGLIAAMLATAYLIMSFQSRVLDASHPFNVFGFKFRQCLSEDVGFVRGHIPQPIFRTFSSLKARAVRLSSSSRQNVLDE